MTERIGDIVVIEKESQQQCDICGRVAELRPYGPNGECVCFGCAMQDEASASRRFAMVLNGESCPPKASHNSPSTP